MLSRINAVLYPLLLKLMFLVEPERIHHLMSRVLSVTGSAQLLSYPLAKVFGKHDPVLHQRVFGVDFPAPLGLAAGFDKSASAINVWGQIGFGYAEVGTITGHAQPGNPQPRLFRLPDDHALINRMGFNNPGSASAATHLAKTRRGPVSVPIGANIGKTKVVPVEDAVDDDVDAVADLAVELGLAGIVATNTTISRAGLDTPAAQVDAIGAGGLSGPPVADRSLEVLRRLYARVGGRIALISVGGISTPDQAWERVLAGANLLQIYTGFIYGGPVLVKEINDGLAARVKAAGFASLADAVGAGNPDRR